MSIQGPICPSSTTSPSSSSPSPSSSSTSSTASTINSDGSTVNSKSPLSNASTYSTSLGSSLATTPLTFNNDIPSPINTKAGLERPALLSLTPTVVLPPSPKQVGSIKIRRPDSDRNSLKYTLTMEDTFKMTIGYPNEGPDEIPVYTKSEKLQRSKVIGFDRFNREIKFQSGDMVPDFSLHMSINLKFPQQIANYLAPMVGYMIKADSMSSEITRNNYRRYYGCSNYSKYAEKKVSAASFYYGCAKLMVAIESKPASREIFKYFGGLSNFTLGECGFLSESYNVIDFYRSRLKDTIEIENAHLIIVRWLLWGLLLDPNAETIRALVSGFLASPQQPFINPTTTTPLSSSPLTTTPLDPSNLFLSSDWNFYTQLTQIINERIQGLLLSLEDAPAAITKKLRLNFSINQTNSPSKSNSIYSDISKVLSQVPHTNKNLKIFNQIDILYKATSLPKSDKQYHSDWCQAIRSRYPEYNISYLSSILDIIIIDDPRVNLNLMSSQASFAINQFNRYRSSFFNSFLSKELKWNQDSFYIDSLVHSKWIVI